MSTKSIWTENNLGFFDDRYNPAFQAGLWAKCPINAINHDIGMGTILQDDFFEFTEADTWTTTEDAGKSGTDGINDETAGWYKNFCDGDDNDESYCHSVGETWKMASGKPLWMECKVRLTEAATDDANWIVGIMEAGGDANTLLDNGGGPAANYDGACFFKVDGDMSIQFETSIATAQVTADVVGTSVSGTAYKLGFYWDGVSSVTPYVNGVAGTAHAMATTGGEANAVFGVKAGGTNEEAIEIDFIKIVQIR